MISSLAQELVFIAAKGALICLLSYVIWILFKNKTASLKTTIFISALICLVALPVAHFLLPGIEIGLPSLAKQADSIRMNPASSDDDIGLWFESIFNPFYVKEHGSAGQQASNQSSVSTPDWLLVIWVAGTVAVLFVYTLRTFSIWVLLSWTRPLKDGSLDQLLQEAVESLHLKSKVTVYCSDLASVPMLIGFFKPVLVLPPAFLEWDEQRQRSVLIHELAHVRRGDNLFHAAGQLACALHWFNPLVWMVKRGLLVEREKACDELVVGSGIKRTEYARHLTQIASEHIPLHRQILLPTAFASNLSLKERIKAVLTGKGGRYPSWLAFMLIIVISLGTLGVAAIKPSSMSLESTPSELAKFADNSDRRDSRIPEVIQLSNQAYDSYYGKKDYPAAETAFKKIALQYPFAGHIWVTLGFSQQKNGHHRLAVSSMIKGIGLIPTYDNLPMHIAHSLLKLGKGNQAEEWARLGLIAPDIKMKTASSLLPEFRTQPWWEHRYNPEYFPQLGKLIDASRVRLPDYTQVPNSQQLTDLIAVATNRRLPASSRSDAVRWIGAHGSIQAAQVLESIVLTDPHEDVVEEAVESYAEMTQGSYEEKFTELIERARSPVSRLYIGAYLLKYKPFYVLDILERDLFNIINEDLNEDILKLISRVKTPEAHSILIRCQMEHPHEDVRVYAGRLLKKN